MQLEETRGLPGIGGVLGAAHKFRLFKSFDKSMLNNNTEEGDDLLGNKNGIKFKPGERGVPDYDLVMDEFDKGFATEISNSKTMYLKPREQKIFNEAKHALNS